MPSGTVTGRSLTGARIGFDGEVDGTDVAGSLSGSGSLDGLVMRLAGDVAVAGDERRVSGLEVAVGPNRLTGDVTMRAGAPLTGRLALDAPEIAPLAALALAEASGSARADIVLDAAEVGQGVSLTAQANDVVVGANRVGALDVQARVEDAFGLPLIDGSLNGRDLALAGVDVASLSATATQLDRRPDALQRRKPARDRHPGRRLGRALPPRRRFRGDA